METKVCTKCFEEKPLEEFPWKNIVKRTRQAVCKVCTARRSADWYANNKEHHIDYVSTLKARRREEARAYIYQYLVNHPCENCGESDPLVLEFHHVEGKEASVSELIFNGPSIIYSS